LDLVANVLFVEEMEGGEADIGDFFIAEDKALVADRIEGLRDVCCRQRGRGCTACQRKTQSSRTQNRHCGGFGCAFRLRSLVDPYHGRILCYGRLNLT
jgi:hypothetical protein